MVDGLDYLAWAEHFGETVATSTVTHAARVDSAVPIADGDMEIGTAEGRGLSYGAAGDADDTSIVDAVFAEMAAKKRTRRRAGQ
ncbi:MAG: hypothetical protein R3C10_18120 [Pirellulales bacterium]